MSKKIEALQELSPLVWNLVSGGADNSIVTVQPVLPTPAKFEIPYTQYNFPTITVDQNLNVKAAYEHKIKENFVVEFANTHNFTTGHNVVGIEVTYRR